MSELTARAVSSLKIMVDVPIEFGLDAESYGGLGRVYKLEIAFNGSAHGYVTCYGDVYKFKKDGTVGKASSGIVYGGIKWETLPVAVRAVVRVAYTEWLETLPRSLA